MPIPEQDGRRRGEGNPSLQSSNSSAKRALLLLPPQRSCSSLSVCWLPAFEGKERGVAK